MSFFGGIVHGLSKKNTATAILATEDGELQVRAIQESELEHASAKGRAYCWTSLDTDIDAGDTRLFIKNTGDRFLVLSRAIFTSSNVACKWSIGIGSATTTPTGTAVTAVNMNQQYSNATESYVAYDDETAVADATLMFQIATPLALDSRVFEFDGIILGKNHYIQINQETESTSGQVAVFGHFEDELV
jgi:hypothetical protein